MDRPSMESGAFPPESSIMVGPMSMLRMGLCKKEIDKLISTQTVNTFTHGSPQMLISSKHWTNLGARLRNPLE